jgi:hypothetical protein
MRRSILIGPALAIALLAAAPQAALGATVRISEAGGQDLIFEASPGERNQVQIRADAGGPDQWHIAVEAIIVDTAPILPGTGCERPDPGDPHLARCVFDRGSSEVIVRLGDRNDSASFASNVVLQAIFVGGTGDDVMSGGSGPDVFVERGARNGSDTVFGGSNPEALSYGSDLVDYRGRRSPVRADLSGDRDDGERGEHDLIGADVEGLSGGRADDRLIGNGARNRLVGGLGADVIRGGAGSDIIVAGRVGVARAATADRLIGGPGSDQLLGSSGANLVDGGPDADLIDAGDGRDRALTRDSANDQLRCGPGGDVARNDPFDFLLGCERRNRYSASSPVPLQIGTPFGDGTFVTVLLGCREGHPASCRGTIQLELRGDPITPEVAFTGANRHRWVIGLGLDPPLPPSAEPGSDLIARVRSYDAAGAPTDEAIPATSLLVGDPFL